jgi:hypothetical protein
MLPMKQAIDKPVGQNLSKRGMGLLPFHGGE